MPIPCDLADVGAKEFADGAQDLEKFAKRLRHAVGSNVPDDVIQAAFEKAAERYRTDSKNVNEIKRQLGSTLNQARVSTFREQATAAGKAILVSSVRLLGRNVVSHGLKQVGEESARIPAAMHDMLRSTVTSTPRTVLGPDVASILRTVNPGGQRWRRGVDEIRQIMKTGNVEGDAWERDTLAQYGLTRETAFKNPITRALVNGVFRLHAATDRPFRLYAYFRALDDFANLQARAEAKAGKVTDVKARVKELMANPTPEMASQAVLMGGDAVFQNDNSVSKAITAGKSQLGPVGKVALDMNAPFTRIPINILINKFEYNGGGLLAAPIKKVLMSQEGALTPEQHYMIGRVLGRGIVGMGLVLLGMYGRKNGWLTGTNLDGAKGYKEQTQTGEVEGSVYMNGYYYQLKGGEPLSEPILLGATLQEQYERDLTVAPDKQSGMFNTAARFINKELSEAPILSTGKALAEGVEKKQPLTETVKQMLSTAVPSAVGDTAKAYDYYIGDTRRRKASTPFEALENRIPGLNRNVPINTKDTRPQEEITVYNPLRDAFRPVAGPPPQKKLSSGKSGGKSPMDKFLPSPINMDKYLPK